MNYAIIPLLAILVSLTSCSTEQQASNRDGEVRPNKAPEDSIDFNQVGDQSNKEEVAQLYLLEEGFQIEGNEDFTIELLKEFARADEESLNEGFNVAGLSKFTSFFRKPAKEISLKSDSSTASSVSTISRDDKFVSFDPNVSVLTYSQRTPVNDLNPSEIPWKPIGLRLSSKHELLELRALTRRINNQDTLRGLVPDDLGISQKVHYAVPVLNSRGQPDFAMADWFDDQAEAYKHLYKVEATEAMYGKYVIFSIRKRLPSGI